MQYAFYFDQSRCMGCNACTVACKDWNQVNPGPVRWRKQETHELAAGSKLYSLVMSCNHCEKPACKDACTMGAISKRSDGIVVVDRSKCQDLKACIDACPFSAPHIADDQQEPEMRNTWSVKHPMQKCTFCWERVAKGEKPICVAACPVHALDFGELNTMANKPGAERLNFNNFPYAYKADQEGKINTDTNPSLFIKKRKDLSIVKLVKDE